MLFLSDDLSCPGVECSPNGYWVKDPSGMPVVDRLGLTGTAESGRTDDYKDYPRPD